MVVNRFKQRYSVAAYFKDGQLEGDLIAINPFLNLNLRGKTRTCNENNRIEFEGKIEIKILQKALGLKGYYDYEYHNFRSNYYGSRIEIKDYTLNMNISPMM